METRMYFRQLLNDERPDARRISSAARAAASLQWWIPISTWSMTASGWQRGEGSRGDAGVWRGEMLSRRRTLVKEADPEVVEEWKWRGVPVWSHDGLICTGETYKNVVKMTFAKGAALKDPSGLFNSSLDGNIRRAIDFHEGEKIDEEALKTLVRAAVTLNKSRAQS